MPSKEKCIEYIRKHLKTTINNNELPKWIDVHFDSYTASAVEETNVSIHTKKIKDIVDDIPPPFFFLP